MLTLQAFTRDPRDGVPGVADALVFGVAITLAILSGVAALSGVLSWRGERPDGVPRSLVLVKAPAVQRRLLIVAAQAGAAVTWLHVFLCRPQWAFVGVREFWSYVVMGLSFVSVGITEWARRRGDQLISDTLRQTSLYLPLIPVIGFWLSSSSAWGRASFRLCGTVQRW